MLRFIVVLFLSVLLAGCADEDHYAPVTDISHMEELPKTGLHRVVSGETLYSIAFRYGLDYRFLASRNQISAPYTILVGQMIYLQGLPMPKKRLPPASRDQPQRKQVERREPHYSSAGWQWPARGKIISFYSATNKGVNIAGIKGQPVYAAAAGKVVYSGNGLKGYGNLIIIKHNSLMLSAYAHNARVLVAEGAWVRQGQKIAEMGNTGTNRVMLHYEIRRAGKPVNPLALYGKRF